MTFIVTCHFLQYYGNELAWWFNVGVQMFLFISGYIFSNLKMDITTLKKQFCKILIPYYIFVTFACALWIAFSTDANIFDIVLIYVLRSYGKFEGLHHLWFISYILLAYVMTPVVIVFLKQFEGSFCRMLVGSGTLVISLMVFFELFATYYNAAWMICYFMGIVIGRLLNSQNANFHRGGGHTVSIICALAIICNCLQIVIDYHICPEFDGIYKSIYNRFCSYSHVLLGISLVFFLRHIYKRYLSRFDNSIVLKLSDKYSYYIYLVHQFFILGCFSLCSIFRTPCIAVLFSLIVIIFCAYYLHKVASKLFDGFAMILF